ncbi:hypothetical protein F5880DRAFT_1619457, partial [Lentinula raphanica]
MTLRDIVFNSDHYGVAKFVITNAKKFVLHTIIRSPNVSYMVNLAEKGLGSDNTISRHFCLSKRIYGIFRSDTNAFVDEGYSALDEDEIELGCNRNDPGSDDDEETGIVAQMLHDPSETLPVTQNDPSNSRNTHPETSARDSPLSRTNVLTEDSALEEAETLWGADWLPVRPLSGNYTFYNRVRLFWIVDEHLRNAIDTEPLGFSIKGESPNDMLAPYIALVQRAINEEDFTVLLSEHRHFQLIAINDGVESYVTSGPGVEKEVMNLFFREKLASHIHDFLIQVIDNYTTLSTVPISSAADISPAKKNELTLFGAAIGLSLVHGSYPSTINPLLLIYLLNGSNL